MEASAIAPPDAAATNVASFGRQRIQAESTASNGHTQNQPGHLDGALIALDRRYRDLAGGELGQLLRHPVGAADLRVTDPRPAGERGGAVAGERGRSLLNFRVAPGEPGGSSWLLLSAGPRAARFLS